MNKNQFLESNCYWKTELSASGKTIMTNKLTNYLGDKNETVMELIGDVPRNIFNIKLYSAKERYFLELSYKLSNYIKAESNTPLFNLKNSDLINIFN